MAIKKLEEIRLNVQPVSIEFVHEYVFEGPCRFGKGDALTKPFDEMINEEKFQDWYTQLKAHMHEDVVNLLPPIRIHGTEDWYIKDEEVRKIITDATPGVEVDLYFSVELGRVFLLSRGQWCRHAAIPPTPAPSIERAVSSTFRLRPGRQPRITWLFCEPRRL